MKTTGLPFYENNKTRIIELSLVAVQANHLRLRVYPRVQNKLSLCFNPWKLISAEAEKITGLSNFKLEEQQKFNESTVKMINNFIEHNMQPVCLVAHNGNNFDFPILRKEINNTNKPLVEDVYCIDTLTMLRDISKAGSETLKSEANSSNTTNGIPFDLTDSLLISITEEMEKTIPPKVAKAQRTNETTPQKQIIRDAPPLKKLKVLSSRKQLNFGESFKLNDVYKSLTNKVPENHHHAEADVQMLIECAAVLGDVFVDWANRNARKFLDIPPMAIGKKIGR
ncbi:unnamed protein product [Acanthoscelides obtectus]|uniref:Exonuclease domain-containing protein n=1 Tax=Acanthoscelides obtectus TaxID=200917 RepID=A0A9P0KGV6_ACAOB|nr:unnamed protein product [Acanthoscelides obtectus]CAK1662936.1 Three prime repair exonuclease 2 [Acanthoscelides obtectus]